jgi:hypothetical protein
MEIDEDKVDDAVLALLRLTLHDKQRAGRASTGTRSTGCIARA